MTFLPPSKQIKRLMDPTSLISQTPILEIWEFPLVGIPTGPRINGRDSSVSESTVTDQSRGSRDRRRPRGSAPPSKDELSKLVSASSGHDAVKTPTLFLLGAQDLRVPVSNGLQYARALREKGVELKVIVFPDDTHGIERPQSDFESFLNIGVWFKKYCK